MLYIIPLSQRIFAGNESNRPNPVPDHNDGKIPTNKRSGEREAFVGHDTLHTPIRENFSVLKTFILWLD